MLYFRSPYLLFSFEMPYITHYSQTYYTEESLVIIHRIHVPKGGKRELLLVVVALVYTGPVLEGVDKARDVVGGDGDDKGICDNRQHPNPLQNAMPDP